MSVPGRFAVFDIRSGTVSTNDSRVLTTHAFAGNNSRMPENPTHIQGMNNPDMCHLHNIGPLPLGKWKFGTWGTYGDLGQHACPLTQVEGETYGRSAIFCHGPGGADPVNSSKGCLCMPHDARIALEAYDPEFLYVTCA